VASSCGGRLGMDVVTRVVGVSVTCSVGAGVKSVILDSEGSEDGSESGDKEGTNVGT
jgi:hypothetical protein